MVANVGELVMFENPKGPLEFCQSMTESHSVYNCCSKGLQIITERYRNFAVLLCFVYAVMDVQKTPERLFHIPVHVFPSQGKH